MIQDCHNCQYYFECDKLSLAFEKYFDGETKDVDDYEGECFDFELSEAEE